MHLSEFYKFPQWGVSFMLFRYDSTVPMLVLRKTKMSAS